MEQNKVRNYLLYAIGEIFLVVIGILIALQINNWNEIRKTSNEEIRILNALLVDLIQASEESARQIEMEKLYAKGLQQLLTDSPQREDLLNHPNVDSLVYSPFLALQTELPVIQTYSDLKSSGKVSLISDSQIREKLTGLENSLLNLQTQVGDNLVVQQLTIDPILIDELDISSVLSSRTPKYALTPVEKNNYRATLNNRKVASALALKLLVTDNLLQNRIQFDEEINALIKLIESQLK